MIDVVHLNAVGVFLYREILCYPTPINFNYWYGIGLLLVFLLVNQVLTGIQVGSYYIVSIDVALSSVDYQETINVHATDIKIEHFDISYE